MLQGVPEKNGLDCLKAMLDRIWVVPLYSVAFLLSGYFFPLSVSNLCGFTINSCLFMNNLADEAVIDYYFSGDIGCYFTDYI